ncbi:MAG: hypothetical protein ACFE0I_17740 [Elainellaceae cyanobacterium]
MNQQYQLLWKGISKVYIPASFRGGKRKPIKGFTDLRDWLENIQFISKVEDMTLGQRAIMFQ